MRNPKLDLSSPSSRAKSRAEEEKFWLDQKKKEEKNQRFGPNHLFGAPQRFTFVMFFINKLLDGLRNRLTIGVALYQSVIVALIVTFIRFLRQIYLNWAASKYKADPKIKNERERLSFQYGTTATGWLSYLVFCIPFLRWAAWRHPIAFVAGIVHATQKNEDVIDNLFNRTPRSQRPYAIRIELSQKRTWMPFTQCVTHAKWLAYENQEDLTRQLKEFLQDYCDQTSFYNRAATLKLRKDRETATGNFLAPTIEKMLTHDSSYIKHFDNTDKMITLINSAVASVFNSKIQSSIKENSRRFWKRMPPLMIAELIFLPPLLYIGLPFALLPGPVLLAAGIASLYSYCNQKFLDYAKSKYTLTTVREVKDRRTWEALRCGVEAATYRGLFYSFSFDRIRSIVLHPISFASAMEHALSNNEVVVTQMKAPRL
ncbi:MAG: hypothetical protein ACHQJ6_08260 [Candidatus Berkiellales bacterium]